MNFYEYGKICVRRSPIRWSVLAMMPISFVNLRVSWHYTQPLILGRVWGMTAALQHHLFPFLSRFLFNGPPSRYYSEGKKRVADVMPIATGHECEELEAELEGRNVLEMNYPVGPFGTKRTISAIDIQQIAKELGQSFIDKEIQEIIEEADRDRLG